MEDAEFLEKFYSCQKKLLKHAGFRLGLSEQDAKDIVQETFLRAYAHKDDYVDTAKPTTWIFRIMRNLHFNNYRRSHDMVEFDEFASGVVLSPTQESGMIQSERTTVVGEAVRNAMARLPEKQRMALTLQRWEDLSMQEVAVAMGSGTTESSVKSLLWRATQALQHSQTLSALQDHGSRSEPLNRKAGGAVSKGKVAAIAPE